jgi:hypothetical protein
MTTAPTPASVAPCAAALGPRLASTAQHTPATRRPHTLAQNEVVADGDVRGERRDD